MNNNNKLSCCSASAGYALAIYAIWVLFFGVIGYVQVDVENYKKRKSSPHTTNYYNNKSEDYKVCTLWIRGKKDTYIYHSYSAYIH
jgi:hypothetical protein